MSTAGSPTSQFGIFAQLVVSKGTQGLDLSKLRFRFEVRASDAETPNTLTVRIYNLAETTVNSIIQEFDTVNLSAGFQNGNKGQIFSGDIKQFKFGREQNVDSYLEILAGDGDEAYNQAVINRSFPAGTTDSQTFDALASAFGLPVAPTANGFLATGGILARGKTQFGMAKFFMRDLARNNDTRWSIQNGVITLVPNTGYLPGDVVVLTSATGMIGQPESTDNGISVRCLLNPNIYVGRAVQIDNASITQFAFPVNNPGHLGTGSGAFKSQFYPASTSQDGLYRVLVVEHVGDTRGNDFYTDLTCLTISQANATDQSVLPTG